MLPRCVCSEFVTPAGVADAEADVRITTRPDVVRESPKVLKCLAPDRDVRGLGVLKPGVLNVLVAYVVA